MVFETKPFKSNLDIYYETSSTGLVSDFNTNIAYPTGSTGQPVDISSFIATWQENINNVTVSNVFQCVDSAGNFILSNNPTISIDKVENLDGPNGNYVIATNPFTLQTIQQPAFNVPATYSLATSSPHAYTDTSYYAGNYKITFKLSATGMQDVHVEKNIALSNIVPNIYRVVNRLGSFSPVGNPVAFYVQEKTNADMTAFLNSDLSSPIAWTATNLDGSGDPVAWSTEVTSLVIDRDDLSKDDGDIYESPVNVSHSTNGAQSLATFTSSNADLQQNAPINERINNIIYQIHAVSRRDCFWHDNDKKFFVGYNTSTENKYSDFSIWKYKGTSYDARSVLFSVAGSFQNSDFPTTSHPSGYQHAFLYSINLKVSDASRGLGFKENFFTFWMIVTKKSSSMFD